MPIDSHKKLSRSPGNMTLETTFIFRMRGNRGISILFGIVATSAMTGDTIGIIILVEKRHSMGDAGW